MSAICGVLDFAGEPASTDTLRAMLEPLAHAGLDGARYHASGELGLGFLALDATPEAVLGRQPLSSLESGVHLVADARLDNRGELLPLLGHRGAASASDADLILAAYRRWGTACPEHLLGDFAFGLWDARARRLFCACDPLGVKRLYYARVGTLFCFASQAQQVLRHPGVPRRLDDLTLGAFLCGGIADMERTPFREVLRLGGGHRLVATAETLAVERYWDVDPERRTVHPRDEDYAAHFHETLSRAVSDRLRAAGQVVAVSMSGGLDSTSVAAMAQRSAEADGRPRLIAGSLVFDTLNSCDERAYIRAMTEELGIEVEHVDAERYWLLEDPAAFTPSLESPLMGWESCDRELLRRFRERGARVVLTGLGGDDVAGGSPLVYADRLWREGDLRSVTEIARHARSRGSSRARAFYYYFVAPVLPRGFARLLQRALARNLVASAPTLPRWVSPDLVRRTGLAERLEVGPRWGWPRRGSARQVIRRHLVERLPLDPAADLFDRSAARWGLEARHPFLDRRLVELVVSMPPRQLYEAGYSKPLLRRAMARTLPAAVLARQGKSDLGVFLDVSLRERAAARVERCLEAPMAAELGYVDPEELRSAYRRYRAGTPDEDLRRIWYAIALEIWLQKYYNSVFSAPKGSSPW